MTRYPANVARIFAPPRDDNEEARSAEERETFLRAMDRLIEELLSFARNGDRS